MNAALRTIRTLSHLKAGQVYARALHEVRQGVYWGAGPLLRLLYRPDASAQIAGVHLPLPKLDLRHQRGVAERWRQGRVEYLGSEGDRSDWLARAHPKLWRYERHYHAELVALAALSAAEPRAPWLEQARALVEDWCAICPPGSGDAWEPYPVARRILNWSLAAALAPELGASLAPSLAAQLRFLRAHVERHLLGNHILSDAAALIAGASILRIPESPEIGAFGASLLAAELRRQTLPDGGYAERTVHYHALVLRDALVARALGGLAGRVLQVDQQLASMARWLSLVGRPGGALPYLNDATPEATVFAREAMSLSEGIGLGSPEGAFLQGELCLPETGWSMIREDGHELLFEHGPIGPPEQPGHGHSDALSYELWWSAVPVVTDSGVTTYERGATRDFERSSRAHATVTVDGEGPDELWASFRVGGRGRVEARPAVRSPAEVHRLEASVRAHAGWEHVRRLLFRPGEALVVLDRVRDARFGSEVLSRIPLDPAWSFRADGGRVSLRGPGDLRLMLTILHGEFAGASSGVAEPREGWVGRGFGRPVARPSLRLRADAAGHCSYAITLPGLADLRLSEDALRE